MRISPKKMARLRREEVDTSDPITILVTGWKEPVSEPLLLEALANHPACKELWYVPLENEKNDKTLQRDFKRWRQRVKHQQSHGNNYPLELQGINATALLRREPRLDTPEAVQAALYERLALPLESFKTHKAQLMLNGTNAVYMDHALERRHPSMHTVNEAALSDYYDDKRRLPEIGALVADATGVHVLPICETVTRVDQVAAFMERYHLTQIALKAPYSVCGDGIYRVFKAQDGTLHYENPSKNRIVDNKEPAGMYPLVQLPFERGMLAMEWLEPAKGDVRVVMLHGHCIGAYRRVAQADSWLCNVAQGGQVKPLDIDRQLPVHVRRKMKAVAETLSHLGVPYVGADFLQDRNGEWLLSEINMGCFDDLVELHHHSHGRDAHYGRLSVADRMAGEMIRQYRAEKSEQALVDCLIELYERGAMERGIFF